MNIRPVSQCSPPVKAGDTGDELRRQLAYSAVVAKSINSGPRRSVDGESNRSWICNLPISHRKEDEMNKSRKILKSIAFLLGSLFIAGLFSAFAAWAMSSLDPAVQQTIGNLNSPLIASESARSALAVDPMKILGRRLDPNQPPGSGTVDR